MSVAPSSHPVATLYADHHSWLHAWLRRKLGCTHRAADLAHDTFERILRTHLTPTTGSAYPAETLREPRAYLTTVASRLVANHYRRQSLEDAWLAALGQMPEATAPSPEEQLLILQTLHQIDALLAALPDKVRSAFLLSQLDGLGYAEIAERLEVTPRTVKRYMAQAFEECLMALE